MPDTTTPAYCAVFALCTNVATTTIPNPILGDVPSCQRCADKIESIEAMSALDASDQRAIAAANVARTKGHSTSGH